MENNIQLILSNYESRYSDLSVFLDERATEFYVYMGLSLLERVSANAEEIGYKMFIGRLYNQGVKLSILRDRFHHDSRTVKKWGNALKTCSVEVMSKAFAGRSATKKTNPLLIRYVLQQYRLRSTLGRSYREKIIQGVKEIFKVTLSPSLVSQIFSLTSKDSNESSKDEKMGTSTHNSASSNSKNTQTVQRSTLFQKDSPASTNGELIHHAGLVLFEEYLPAYSWFDQQMLRQILSGAVNVEQSKTLCFESLSRFSPKVIKTLRKQRQLLDQRANLENELELYRMNAQLLDDGPGKGKIYYFDPHTKHYTGILKILKGWCGSLHSISKIINLDTFHTQSGRPCFIQHYSSYYDMRERFFMSLAVFDKLFAPEERCGRTFVVDRGIFGVECFKRFEYDYLITWEKGTTVRDGMM